MFTRGIILSVLAAVGMTAAFGQEAVTSTHTISLPPAGIGSTETMQVTVTNLAANGSNTTASCTGSVSFLNSNGATIGTATTYTATAGQSVDVKLPFASAASSGSRVDVRPVIASTQTSGAPCVLAYSLQTYDTSSGVTHLYLASATSSEGPVVISFGR